MSGEPDKLNQLHALTRLGLTCMLLVMIGGFAASAGHMRHHHENRDERPGFTIDDVRGAYHGINAVAPMLRQLRSPHPNDVLPDEPNLLPDEDRQILIDWLTGDRISEDYDNLDLGDSAPAELIAINCMQCHSRNATEEYSKHIPFDYWDDVKAVAFSRDVSPTSEVVLLASTHTHALALAVVTILLAALMVRTHWPRSLSGVLIFLCGAGLLIDLTGQWFARDREIWIYGILIGGAVFGITSVLMSLAVIIDMWIPRRKAA